MLVFFSDDSLLKKIEHICNVSGINSSEFVERAVKLFLSSPEIIKILEGEARLSEVQRRSINKLKSTSRVAALMDYLDAIEQKDISEKYKKIISMRFGLGEYKPHTLEEIGAEFGVTRERVRQIISKLLLNPAEQTVPKLFDPSTDVEEESFDIPGLLNIAEEEFDLDIDKTIRNIGSFFSLDYEELMSSSRKAEVALVRQIAMFILKEKLGLSASRVGRVFNRDHTTVLHGLGVVENKLHTDKKFTQLLNKVIEKSIGKISIDRNDSLDTPPISESVIDESFEIFLLPKITTDGVEIHSFDVMNEIIDKLKDINIPSSIKIAIEKNIATSLATFRSHASDSELIKTRLETLDLSPRTLDAITKANVRTLGGLMHKSRQELLSIKGLGIKGLEEIERQLWKLNIQLK